MGDERIEISRDDVAGEDRFHRFRLIGWWNQEKLANARVFVAGAGALGNEIIKNLALLGVGNILIADMDNIENSNLSRSVLYRASDNGRSKAEAAAEGAKEIFPDTKAKSFHGNIVYDLGMGVYRWADAVLAGMDNREARLYINRCCWKTNKPFFDGAIEAINGVARVFIPPDSSCYECTMNDTDWKELQARRSCNLLTRQEMEGGKVPTTPTISSIISAVQCQELVKYLHGMETLSGAGFVFNGVSLDSYTVTYPRKEDCMSHDVFDEVLETDFSGETTTLAEIHNFAVEKLGQGAVIELNNDILIGFSCGECGDTEYVFKSLGKSSLKESMCPKCGKYRDPEMTHTITGQENYLQRTLKETGIPLFDILTARSGMNEIFFELTGDRDKVLGELL
ncbi:MAG: ThiF family adenylyltransferase [Firmicutes bacterium]|nr:ThiF family adenylyltransferase [Bacillota bacterium]